MSNTLSRFACLLAVITLPLLAQNTAGMGSITGVVQDATGAVLPGAKVIVENPSKGIRRELEANGSGVYNAPSLVPAAGYQVVVSKPGFASYEVKDIVVSVGSTVNINPTLSVSNSSTAVEVTSEAPIVESSKTDVSQVVTSRQILELPINGRRVDSFVLLTPGVTNDAAFGLLAFRGNPGGNTFLTDGNDTTNQYYNENAGRTRTYNISQDAVQEFQVVTSNFLAEYGRASGGVVNTVTRSGSNDIHGTAYWFFRNRTLNATDITATGINPPEYRHQAGASVGGPIKKNKLFYFFNGELQRRNFPIVSTNTTSNFFDSRGNYIPGNCAAPATAAQCSAAVAFLTARVAPQLVPRTTDVNLLFGKIDYQLNQRNSLTFSVNYLDFRSPNGIQTQLSLTNGAAIGNNANTNVFDRTAKAGLTTIVSPNAVNEIRYGLFKDRQFDPASPSLLPSTGLVGLSISSLTNVGYATSYPRTNPSELRNSISDTFSLTLGKHSLKVGADFANVEDYVNSLPTRYGSYTFPSLTTFAQDFSDNAGGGKHWSAFSQNFGNPIIDITLKEVSFFAQDQYRITPKLTLSPGVRYEYTTIPQPKQVNPAWPQTGVIPNNSGHFAPRLGLAYAPDSKTAFRAGYGMFYNRIVSSTIANLFLNNGLYQPSYRLNGSTPAQQAGGPVFPNNLSAPPNVTGSASIAFADKHFQNPYSQQIDVAIERQIAKNSSFTASYVWSRGLHLLSGRDINVAAPTQSYTYAILDAARNPVGSFTTPLYTQRLNPAFGQVTLVDSGNNSYYNALILQFVQRYSTWFQGSAAYTWGHAIDYNVGGGGGTIFTPSITSVYNGNYSGEKGSSSIDQRHRLVVNGVANPKFVSSDGWAARYLINNWQLSAISTFASAQPLAPTVNVTVAPAGVLNNSRLTGLGGPARVPFESISLVDIDQLYRTDARLTKIIPVTERLKVQLMFEAFNVFNHPYYSGSGPRNVTQFNTATVNGVISLVPNPLFNAPLQTQTPPDGTTARRAQVAIRITF